jgi:hypothetical protein
MFKSLDSFDRKLIIFFVSTLYVLFALFVIRPSRADASTYHADLPAQTIKSRLAIKEAASDKPVYRCAKMAEKSGTVRKAKGAKYKFATALPATITEDQFDALLADKKRPVKCDPVERDGGKWQVNDEDAEDDEE